MTTFIYLLKLFIVKIIRKFLTISLNHIISYHIFFFFFIFLAKSKNKKKRECKKRERKLEQFGVSL